MENDNLHIRLQAIELAIKRLSTSIIANEGPIAEHLVGHINFLKDLMNVPDLSASSEAIFYRTVMLLDPISNGPWEESS